MKVHSFEKSREGDLLMVMESINGHSLAEELKRGALPVERAVEIWLQICRGMTAVHQLGIVHRDLKPSNIMLTTDGDGHELVKVVDFGIARLVAEEGSQSLTRTESVLGSPRYMSPEQWQSAKVDLRSDIYSFGCLMYECLAGAPPFVDDNVYALMTKHLNGAVPDLKGSVAPRALLHIIGKALNKSVDDRFQSMQEIIGSLEDAREQGLELEESVNVRRSNSRYMIPVVVVCALALIAATISMKRPSATQLARAPVPVVSRSRHPVGKTFYPPTGLRDRKIASSESEIRDFYKQWLGKHREAPPHERGQAYYYCGEYAASCKDPVSELL